MIVPLQTVDLVTNGATVAGLAAVAGAIAVIASILYRWYTHEIIPPGLPILTGLAGVAIYLNTTAALGQAIGRTPGLFDLDTAVLNVLTFAIATVAAMAGRRIGDVLARESGAIAGAREVDGEVSRLVRSVGRVTTVTLPPADRIDDIDGYDPVEPGVKDRMAEKVLVFPRRLTVAELQDRLITRLKEDYGPGHVSVDLADDGSVEYLAIGSRASGIGPTLPPGTAATAVRADPPFSATSGDVVHVWTADDSPERVATAEFRGKADDIVTLLLDEADAEAIDPTRRYRLVVLPADPRPELEFASLLRSADETMAVITIDETSDLSGRAIGAIDATVVAVRAADGTVDAIPSRSRTLTAGETVYVIARPEALRALEARPPAPEAESS